MRGKTTVEVYHCWVTANIISYTISIFISTITQVQYQKKNGVNELQILC